jgi:hypothetical protein
LGLHVAWFEISICHGRTRTHHHQSQLYTQRNYEWLSDRFGLSFRSRWWRVEPRSTPAEASLSWPSGAGLGSGAAR